MKIPPSILKMMLVGASGVGLAAGVQAMSTPQPVEQTATKPAAVPKPAATPTPAPTPKPAPRPISPDHCPACGMG